MSGLVERWDAQQSAYIASREQRFAAMLDVLELSQGTGPITVVDLACGPGSLSARVLQRLPQAHVVAVDIDPVLLQIAREHLAPYGDRATVLDADLAGPDWVEQIAGPVHAAMSTTALHWLAGEQLVALFRQVARLLEPGGVFLDGDHFRFDGRHRHIREWADRHDRRTQREAFDAGADGWDEWWAAVAAEPHLKALIPERERRFADRPPPPPTAVDFRLAALSQAGFDEVGTAWQLLDDYVVYALR